MDALRASDVLARHPRVKSDDRDTGYSWLPEKLKRYVLVSQKEAASGM